MRVVKMIASDVSLSLSSAFSSDFSTEINFMIYKKQDEYVPPEVIKEREKQERDALENAAFGIYKGAGYVQRNVSMVEEPSSHTKSRSRVPMAVGKRLQRSGLRQRMMCRKQNDLLLEKKCLICE